MTSKELTGKVALVTGAGRGLGREIALLLSENGAKVVVADIDYALAASVAKEMKSRGNESLAIEVDVTKSTEVEEMARKTHEKFGRIDILVNNAGVHAIAPVVELEERDWDRCLAVNVKGPFLCSKYVAPYMIRQQTGKIVNISSTAGKRGAALRAAYCASKFAVIGLTQVLAKELAPHNINVNAVCPGLVYTDMWQYIWKKTASDEFSSPRELFDRRVVEAVPLRRPQTADDMARAVLFLVSDASKNITGQSINVDGGVVM